MDRIPSAHANAILSLDWTLPPPPMRSGSHSGRYGGPSSGAGLFDDILPGIGSGPQAGVIPEADGTGEGWLVSGSLDRTVKVCASLVIRAFSAQ